MAIKTTGTITPVAKTSGKGDAGDTAFSSFQETIRAHLRDAGIQYKKLGKEGYRSTDYLKKFNLSIKAASLQVNRLEADLKDIHSKVFGHGSVDPKIKSSIGKYEKIGQAIGELVAITNTIDKSLSKLRNPNLNSKAFYSSYIAASSALSSGREIIPSGRASAAGKDAAAVFREVFKSASSELRGMGVSNLSRGMGLVGRQPTFTMGGSIAEAFNSKFAKDQLRDQRSFSQESFRYTQLGPGMYEAQYERSFPSPKLGKNYKYNKNNLPMMMGGGIGGPPVFSGGGVPGPYQGGLPAFNRGGLPSPYGQTVFATRMGGGGQTQGSIMGGGRGGFGGFGFGILLAAAAAALPEVGAYEAGRTAVHTWNAFTGAARPGYPDLERIGRAGRMTGKGPEEMRTGLVVPGKELAMSPFLSRLGYPTAADAADVYSAYGSPYRSTHAFAAATNLAQAPLTGFQGATEWASHFQRLQSMGIGAGAGGLDANVKAIEEGTRIGVQKGMPPEQVFHNMETFLRIMASTNTLRSPAEITRFATLGSTNSALPGVRDLSALASQQGVYKNTLENPLSDPLYFASLMTQTKSITGSFTPGAAGVQKVINARGGNLKLDTKTRRAIDLNRNNPAIVWGLVGSEGTAPEFTENIRWGAQYQAFKNMGLSDRDAKIQADMFVMATTSVAARPQYLANRGYGPMMSKPKTSMSDFDAMLGMTADRAGVTFSGAGRPFALGSIDTGEFKRKVMTIPGIARTDFKSPTLGDPYGLAGSLLEKARLGEGGDLSVTLEKAGVDIDHFGGRIANASKSITNFMDAIGRAIHWIDVKTGAISPGSGSSPPAPVAP